MSSPANVLSPEKVKRYRRDNGFSQELLAKASGLSLRTIQRVEKDGKASSETQLALAATFNVYPKELFKISINPDVNWNWRNIMQSAFALFVVCGVVVMLTVLAGGLSMFIDFYSFLFLALFMYSGTVIAFGSKGLVKSILGLRYLFSNDIADTPASQYLAIILSKQIYFLYGGAIIAFVIGIIAIQSNMPADSEGLGAAYAVSLLVVLYAAIFAEGILRPLAIKLTNSQLK